MGLAAHQGLVVRLDAAGRAVGGMLHDDTGYIEYEFDGGTTDHDGALRGSLRIERSNLIGRGPWVTVDARVSAPLLDQ
jgi:hypothetical protein